MTKIANAAKNCFKESLPGENTERLVLRAVSSNQMVALVQNQRQRSVVKSLHSGLFQLADRVQRVRRSLLSGQFDIVHASFQRQNQIQGVRHANLLEKHLFLGPFNGQIEAGSLLVELDTGVNGHRPDGFLTVLHPFVVDLQERPHKGLENLNGFGFGDLNPPVKDIY